MRPWPQIADDLERLVTTMTWTGDYTAQGELAPVLIAELHGAYVRLPHQRPEVLLGLMRAYSRAVAVSNLLGTRGLPSLAARAMQQCAEILDDPVWLGYAAWWRGHATSHLNRAAHYRRSVATAESLISRLGSSDALQACGLLHLSAAWAAGAQADHDTAATHLAEASALAEQMEVEVGTWTNLWFGPTVGIWKTSIALEHRDTTKRCRPPKRCTPKCCPPPSTKPGSGPTSAGPWSRRRRPATKVCTCSCTPSSSPPSGSTMTCSSGKRSSV